jgi:glycosyltransferase involved in cell wall biosynthesis
MSSFNINNKTLEENYTTKPIVTVVTPIYNTGKYVIKTLESIKSQTYEYIEHILIDDASTDNSFDLVSQWIKKNNYKCILLKNEKNKGLVWNINHALEISNGYYFYCIGDDTIKSTFIQICVREFENCEKDIALLFSNAYEMDEDENLLKEAEINTNLLNFNNLSPNEQFKMLLAGNPICAPTIFTKKKVIKDLGGYSLNYTAEDIQLTLNITRNNYRLRYLGHVNLTYYRIRKNSMTGVLKSRGSEAPLMFYSQFLNINFEYDKILAPRYYYWTKRLLMYERYNKLKWPWLAFKLNKDYKSFLLIIQAIYNRIKY